jgi:hypothetical protein
MQLDLFGKAKPKAKKSPQFYSDVEPGELADEHLFRRWQAGEMCADLGHEHGMSEMQMAHRIARIWRRLGRQ